MVCPPSSSQSLCVFLTHSHFTKRKTDHRDSREPCQKIVHENSARYVALVQEPLPPGADGTPRVVSRVSNPKGYCTARTCFGLTQGACYCEVEVCAPAPPVFAHTEAHCRLGFSTARGDIEAPVGYDWFGFAYRDVDGSAVHQSVRRAYGAPFGVGDVVGMLIRLPALAPPAEGAWALPADRVWKLDERFVPTRKYATHTVPGSCATDRTRTVEWLQVHPGSSIEFSVNGVAQGVAFRDIPQGTYYPAVSLYMGATVRVHFGPDDFRYMSPERLRAEGITPAGLLRPRPRGTGPADAAAATPVTAATAAATTTESAQPPGGESGAPEQQG